MKKYAKPALYCESFQLTEMIAGTCDILCNSQSSSCESDMAKSGYEFGPFTQSDTVCLPKFEIGASMDGFEAYCYWNGDNALFTS